MSDYDIKKSYSKTYLTQEDKSIKVGGDAETILGPGASLATAAPGGVVLDQPKTSGGDIIFNQYPEAVADTVSDLIKTVGTSVGLLGQVSSAATGQLGQMFTAATGQIGQVSSAATGQLGEALSRQQIGGETILPKLVLYLTVGVGVMLIASRMFRK